MAMNEMQSSEIGAEEAVEDSLVELVREHPWAAILGAAALGYVLARIIRGGK